MVVSVTKSQTSGTNAACTSGKYASNSTTLPIALNGGTCSDPNTEFTPAQLQAVRNKTSVNLGTIFIDQETEVPDSVIRNVFRGKFLKYSMAEFDAKTPADGFITYGSCQILESSGNPTHLNAGPALTVSGPGGEQASAAFTTLKDGRPGDYRALLASGFIPSRGGTFTFSNGAGSNAAGSINRPSVTMPAPIVWTNMNRISTINRSQGVNVTWSGGAPGTFVVIQGSSSTPPATAVTTFACAAPVNSGQFSVPPSLLSAMPAGSGDLVVRNVTFPVPFSASGLDLGTVFAEISWKLRVAYQ